MKSPGAAESPSEAAGAVPLRTAGGAGNFPASQKNDRPVPPIIKGPAAQKKPQEQRFLRLGKRRFVPRSGQYKGKKVRIVFPAERGSAQALPLVFIYLREKRMSDAPLFLL